MHENIKTLPPAKSQLGRRDGAILGALPGAKPAPLQCRFEAVGCAGLSEPGCHTVGEPRRDAEQRGAAGRAGSVRGVEAHLSSRLWRDKWAANQLTTVPLAPPSRR